MYRCRAPADPTIPGLTPRLGPGRSCSQAPHRVGLADFRAGAYVQEHAGTARKGRKELGGDDPPVVHSGTRTPKPSGGGKARDRGEWEFAARGGMEVQLLGESRAKGA